MGELFRGGKCLPVLGLFAHRHFELRNRKDPQETAKLFSVPDFVGDACKAIASRVRGAVASVTVRKEPGGHCWKGWV